MPSDQSTIASAPRVLIPPQKIPTNCLCCSENMLFAPGITATEQPIASASSKKAAPAPDARSLGPASRMGLSFFLRNDEANSIAAASEAGSLTSGPTTALIGPGGAHEAPARLVGISIYAGFFAKRAVLIAESIRRGASSADRK